MTSPVPEPPSGGGVLKVEAVGMCGSDVAQLHGHKHVPGEKSPVVPGHEIVGRVHALRRRRQPGRGGGRPSGGLTLLCELRLPATTPSGLGEVYGYTLGVGDDHGLWGGYGEYMGLLPGTHLIKLTDDIDAAELTLFEPLASVCNWFGMLPVDEGDTVVVQGPGHMGLVCAAEAKRRGRGDGDSYRHRRRQLAPGGGPRDWRRCDHRCDRHRPGGAGERDHRRGHRPTWRWIWPPIPPLLCRCASSWFARGARCCWPGSRTCPPVELITDLIVYKGLRIQGGSGSTPTVHERGRWPS